MDSSPRAPLRVPYLLAAIAAGFEAWFIVQGGGTTSPTQLSGHPTRQRRTALT
jgi:hypothetical protein